MTTTIQGIPALKGTGRMMGALVALIVMVPFVASARLSQSEATNLIASAKDTAACKAAVNRNLGGMGASDDDAKRACGVGGTTTTVVRTPPGGGVKTPKNDYDEGLKEFLAIVGSVWEWVKIILWIASVIWILVLTAHVKGLRLEMLALTARMAAELNRRCPLPPAPPAPPAAPAAPGGTPPGPAAPMGGGHP